MKSVEEGDVYYPTPAATWELVFILFKRRKGNAWTVICKIKVRNYHLWGEGKGNSPTTKALGH